MLSSDQYTVYGIDNKETLPEDAPTPLGNRVTITIWFDVNLLHDLLSGKTITGVIHYFNGTPIKCFSNKKQETVETATNGAEFIATRKCLEQLAELRIYLRYLGVPINDTSYAFRDNKSMIHSVI